MWNEFLQQTINGLAWGSIYALIALGYTMVFGVLRLINFAHGDIYMMGAMVGYYAARFFLGWGGESVWIFPLVLFASMGFCALLGFLIEKIAYKPLRKSPALTALITAIGVSLFLQYGGQLVFGADPKFFPPLLEEKPFLRFSVGDSAEGRSVSLSQIHFLIFSVSLFLMAGIHWIVRKTSLGRAMRAVSFSHTASQLVGIPLDRVVSFTFVMGSALAGAASVLVGLSNPKVEPLMGVMPGLKAFVAAVLGGIGSIPGAWLGGLLMGLSETYVVGYLSSTYRDALAFILLILILLLKPTGLLGRSSSEKV